MTKVLVDALSARLGGGLTQLSEQLRALEAVRPDLDLEVLAAPWNVHHFRDNLESTVRSIPVPTLGSRMAYEHLVMPLRARSADVLFCPGNFCPALWAGSPVVLLVANPNYFGAGRRFSPRTRRIELETGLCHRSVRRADAVIVVSDSLRTEMASEGLPLSHAETVHTGLPVLPEQSAPPEGLSKGERYFLLLSNDYPHKRLLDAVTAWRKAFQLHTAPPALVIAGAVSDRRKSTLAQSFPGAHRGKLRFAGPVENRSAVRWLLERAIALVCTSALEALPLTPLEAGSVGCPLVLSDIAPHREVAPEWVTRFPVGNTSVLAAILARMEQQPPERTAWLWPVTWEQNAARLATILERTARRKAVR